MCEIALFLGNFCTLYSHGEKLLRKGGLPSVVEQVNYPPLKFALGAEKTACEQKQVPNLH